MGESGFMDAGESGFRDAGESGFREASETVFIARDVREIVLSVIFFVGV